MYLKPPVPPLYKAKSVHERVLVFFASLDTRVWFVREFGQDLMAEIIRKASVEAHSDATTKEQCMTND